MSARDWKTALDDATERCESAGRPLTAQRREVLRALCDADDHPTADALHGRLAKRGSDLSRATVFRSLEMLADLGLARRVSHIGVGVRYDARIDRHHHFLCRVCASITDFDDDTFDGIAPRVPGRHATDSVHVTCVGVCEKCARKKRRDES